MDTAQVRATEAAAPTGEGARPAAPGPTPASRRPYRFRDGLRHSSATHLLLFLALLLGGVGPKAPPRQPRREVLVAFHTPAESAPRREARSEPRRELDSELPPEPELVPVEPPPDVPLPEPELAEVSDPRALLRRLPPEPLAQIEPPPEAPAPEPPPVEPLAQAPEPEPAPSAPVPVAAVRRAPELLFSQPPSYPLASYRMGHQGVVLLRIHIARDGTVIDVELVESSGYERLDQAALAAVRRWRYRPASEDGASVDDEVLHRVVFRIES